MKIMNSLRVIRWLPVAALSLAMAWILRAYFDRPVWGDEPSYLYNQLIQADFSFFFPWNYENKMGHPPLHPFFLWLGHSLFQSWVFSGAILSFLSAVATLGAVMKTTEELARLEGDRQSEIAVISAGWISVFFLASLPVFLGSSIAVLANMPMLACGLWGIWFCWKRKYIAAGFLLTASVLLNESGLAFVSAAFLIVLFDSTFPKRKYIAVGVPVALLVFHFLLTWFRFGTWSTHPYASGELLHTDAAFFSLQGKWRSVYRFYFHLRNNSYEGPTIYFLIVPFLVLYWAIRFKGRKRIFYISQFVAALGFFVFFLLYEDHIPRDFLPCFAFVAVTTGVTGGMILNRVRLPWKEYLLLATLGVLWFKAGNWTVSQDIWIDPLPNMRTVEFLKEELSKLDKCCSGLKVHAYFPIREYVTNLTATYVSKPIQFVSNENEADVLLISSEDGVIEAEGLSPQERLDRALAKPGHTLWHTKKDGNWIFVYKLL